MQYKNFYGGIKYTFDFTVSLYYNIYILTKGLAMFSGVYKLTFSSGAYYWGSSNDIDRRWQEHRLAFQNGTAAERMQREYDLCGMPKFEVYFPCHQDHVDLVESALIQFDNSPLLLNRQTPRIITSEEWMTICDCQELLEASTCDHLKLIFRNTELLTQKNMETLQLKQELENKQAEVDQLKSSGVYMGDEAKQRLDFFEMENTLLEQDLSEAIGMEYKLREELEQLKGMNVWQRLFHWSW